MIILDFSAVKEAEIIPSIGKFQEGKVDFRGISGGPVFAHTTSNPGDISLLGIVYKGSDEMNRLSSLELVYARPINLLKEFLEKV